MNLNKKNFVCISFVLLLALSLIACGGSGGASSSSASSSSSSSVSSSSSSSSSNSSSSSSSSSSSVPAPIAYDGFNYTPGVAMLGLNGGTGWSGSWNITDGFVSHLSLGSSLSGTITTGLTYTDTTGRMLDTIGGAWQTDPSVFFGQAIRPTSINFGTAGSTIWMSFLVKQSAPSTTPVTPHFNYASASLGTGYTFNSHALSGGIGLYNAGGVIGVGAFYADAAASQLLANWYEGSVGLLVIRIDFNQNVSANDNLSLWLNPELGTDPGVAALTTSIDNYADVINGITLAWGDYRGFVLDEVRIGNSYAAVTPHH